MKCFYLAFLYLLSIVLKTRMQYKFISGNDGCNATQYQEKLQAAATLLQVYANLIYQGPSLVSSLVKKLSSA